MNFNIGDRVTAIERVDGMYLAECTGTVIGVGGRFSPYELCVEFDDAFDGGHDARGTGKDGHCRFGYKREFILGDQEDITEESKELNEFIEGFKVV